MNNWDQFQSTPKLLPPSVFERTSNTSANSSNTTAISDLNTGITSITNENESSLVSHRGESQFSQLSKELEKLKDEIRKLHGENETLRHRNKDFIEQAHIYTEATGHRQISISALEEVIHKQRREIQSLKSDLISEKESTAAKLKESETKWTLRMSEVVNKLSTVEIEKTDVIKAKNELNEQLKKENTNLTEKFQSQMNNLTDEKKSLVNSHEKEIAELKSTIEQLKLNSLKEKELNDLKIQELTEENRRYSVELQTLRVYINDAMPTRDTVKELNKEKEKLLDEMNKLKNKNDSLIKENSALQIRFKSINEILIIQEAQLEAKSQSTTTSSSNASSSASTPGLINAERKKQGLLNKWRTKVYELLVQLKSLEINSKLEKSTNEKLLTEFNSRLDESRDKNKILENQIEGKKAELSMLENKSQTLATELTRLKEVNIELSRKNAHDLQTSVELKNFVEGLFKQYETIEESFRVANRKLSNLDQRVEFAKNRLNVIKALYKRRNNNETNHNVLEMTENLSSIHGSLLNNNNHPNHDLLNQPPTSSIDPNKQHDQQNSDLIRQELDKVVNERDMLAKKLENDLLNADEKLNKAKNEYDLRVSLLNNEVKELRELNEINKEKYQELNEQLLIKETLNEEMRRRYENERNELNLFKEKMKESFENEIKKVELEFADKLSKMDQNLNEARREQAKALVLMRQMERSTNREKSRLENLLQSTEAYYKDYVEKLQSKIASLEKEKNILMNSLRQQGKFSDSVLKNVSVEKQRVNLSELKHGESRLEINKWIESNESLQEMSNRNRLLTNLDKIVDLSGEEKTNATSFWLDSREKIEESNNNNTSNVNEEEGEEDGADGNGDLDNSDLHKNSEILQQIRKIMGNLELSDIEDELDNEDRSNNSNNYSDLNIRKTVSNGKSEDEEMNRFGEFNLKTGNGDEEEDDYLIENEHAIDDESIFKQRNKY